MEDLVKYTKDLEAKLKPYYDRKQSFADLETLEFKNKSELEQLKAKYDCDQNKENCAAIDAKIAEYQDAIEKADRK